MTNWQKWLEGAVFAVAGGAIAALAEALANGETDPKKLRTTAIAGAVVTTGGLLRQWRSELFKTETVTESTTSTTPTTMKIVDTMTTTTTPVVEPVELTTTTPVQPEEKKDDKP